VADVAVCFETCPYINVMHGPFANVDLINTKQKYYFGHTTVKKSPQQLVTRLCDSANTQLQCCTLGILTSLDAQKVEYCMFC
jgi:hypothetical protein